MSSMAEISPERLASPDDLYRRCDPDQLGFETTATVPPLDGTVGQERAVAALDFGLEIRADGYNLFLTGPAGTGRNSTLRASVRRIARERPLPPDWCYVENFRDPRQPSVMSLPAGRGHALAESMDTFVAACRREIPRSFDSEAYAQRREELTRDLQNEREQSFAALEQEARKRGFALNATPMGIVTVPLKEDGSAMGREEFEQLAEETRKSLQAKGDELQPLISQALVQARRVEKEAQERLAELDKSVAVFTITPLLNELRQEYMDIPKALQYIEQVEDDIVEHLGMFRAPEPPPPLPLMRSPAEEFLTRYKVNVVVAHDGEDGAPVVIEDNPTFYNVFGRVDYRSQLGAMTTDHTMIKAGALHRANGGYLVLQALDVLRNPLVWDTLKRTIRCRETRIENLGEQFSAIPVATLTPEPIPLDVKIVLVGGLFLYHMLYRSDEDFRKLFRVKADFGGDMERTPDCLQLYAGFISSQVQEEGLRQFDKTAVARVIEHSSRTVEHQNKLSTRFTDIATLLTEADFWAAKAASDVVLAEHVERAIEEQIYRSNQIEERIHEFIEDGTILIDTTEGVVGQVNGISVYDLGDYSFGRPTRITASVSLGRGQVVSIEREIQMSGRIHSKGFAIVNGYLNATFAQDRQLSFSASIGFEQTYDEIDGDSASAAELYVLLSSLADAPIRQGIAVTGSVNQRGEVQAIGGVNQKIEGFYAVCKAKGLTGEQGVAIPRQNAHNLMLRQEVVEAVREGRFHVWLVDHVDQGIEILTGVPAGERDARGRYPANTINRRVTDKLAQMTRKLSAQGQRRRPRSDSNGHRNGQESNNS